jgi:hypothetical protein
VGSIIITIWGIGHIAPTKSIVSGFGPLSPDNRRIITMEWVAEGLTLCFIGVLTLLAAVVLGSGTAGGKLVCRASAIMLLALSIWSMLTGGRTTIVPIKICPVVKTAVAILFVVGTLI